MIDDTFLSLVSKSKGSYKEKGSKFLAYAYPVSNESQIKEILVELRKEHYDARHHCYAYVLGADKNSFRANDDGEPNHSAGDPILGQIRSNNLTNLLIIVVRYFGGTKLGVGGLINAYKTAAADAIANSEKIKHVVKKQLSIQFTYEQLSQVMRLVKDYNARIIHQQFEDSCKLQIEIRLSELPRISENLKNIYGVNIL